MTGRPILVAFAVCLFASTLAAQEVKEEIFTRGVIGGVITDGVNQWEITGASATDGVLTDFEVPIGSDHQFSNWWWYRVAGDTAETIMPPPDTESYNGSIAILTWNNVDGRNLFSVSLEVQLFGLTQAAALLQTFVVTNLSASNLSLQVFSYTDMDMDTSPANDSAILGLPRRIDIVDLTPASHEGVAADGYRVDTFPNVRNALNDTLVDNFANTGLPFAPGDYTGGFQWGWVLAPGAEHFFYVVTCVNTTCIPFIGPPFFADGFETGNTANWDATVP